MEKSIEQTAAYSLSKKDSPGFEINEYKRTIKEARLVLLAETLLLPFLGFYFYEGINPVAGLIMVWGSILVSLGYMALSFYVSSKPYTITIAALGIYLLLLIVTACIDVKAIRDEWLTELLIIYIFYQGLREYKKAEKWLSHPQSATR